MTADDGDAGNTKPLFGLQTCCGQGAASVRMADRIGVSATQMLLDYGCQAS
jgi:hypothetical protein